MDELHLEVYKSRYDAILFDVGNTLVYQNNPNTKVEDINVRLLPGVETIIKILEENFALGLVTNTTNLVSQDIIKLLEKVGLDKYFKVCIASAEIGIHKPDPTPVNLAIQELGLENNRVLFVGDNEVDELAATAAGVDFLFTQANIQDAFKQFAIAPNSALDRSLHAKIEFDFDGANSVLRSFDDLVKPPGSLGFLEKITSQIAGITHQRKPQIDPAAIAVFTADHGIGASDAVTPWPQEITGIMTELIAERKAAISVISEVSDIYLQVINVGNLKEAKNPLIKNIRVASGTNDFRFDAAMSLDQAKAAVEIGARTAERLVAGGSRSLACGEVGIGNTTSAAILISHFTKKGAFEVTGYGSGIDKTTFDRKVKIVDEQIQRVRNLENPLEVLRQVGGFEIAALTGFILRGCTLKVPVILDGVITVSAALVAYALKPEIRASLIAGHCSLEPGAKIALDYLELKPVLNLDLRLGEGTGAALAVPILRSACAAFNRMGKLKDIL